MHKELEHFFGKKQDLCFNHLITNILLRSNFQAVVLYREFTFKQAFKRISSCHNT